MEELGACKGRSKKEKRKKRGKKKNKKKDFKLALLGGKKKNTLSWKKKMELTQKKEKGKKCKQKHSAKYYLQPVCGLLCFALSSQKHVAAAAAEWIHRHDSVHNHNRQNYLRNGK